MSSLPPGDDSGPPQKRTTDLIPSLKTLAYEQADDEEKESVSDQQWYKDAEYQVQKEQEATLPAMSDSEFVLEYFGLGYPMYTADRLSGRETLVSQGLFKLRDPKLDPLRFIRRVEVVDLFHTLGWSPQKVKRFAQSVAGTRYANRPDKHRTHMRNIMRATTIDRYAEVLYNMNSDR